ncbi:hypothetical protein G9A89_021136 [Geosiphon pyriformis]|nr:hypothetical protein G9A89_021136 [Geosiphon pyriformis]
MVEHNSKIFVCLLLTIFLALFISNETQFVVSQPQPTTAKTYKSVEECLAATGAKIVLASDPLYQEARLGERIRVQHYPTAITFPTNTSQVQALVLCSTGFQHKPIPRNGGHSDNSIVIDVSKMVDISINQNAKTAIVGAGWRIGPLYLRLDQEGFTIVAGTCPSVGLSGLIAAGGYGIQSRQYGVTGDLVAEAKVVTADGNLVNANAQQNSDLFWAVRGGGGGTFGIVTQWTLNLIPSWKQNTVFKLTYPLQSALTGFKLWSEWAPKSPNNVSAFAQLNQNEFIIVGHFLGTPDQIKSILDAAGLRNIGGTSPSETYQLTTNIGARAYFAGNEDQSVLNIGTSPFTSSGGGLVTEGVLPGFPAGPKVRRELEKTKSMYFDKPLTSDQVKVIIDLIARSPGASYAAFDPYGGIFAGQPSDLTAFPHRAGTLFGLQVSIFLTGDQAKDKVDLDWIKSWDALVRPFSNGYSYQGYVDADLQNPQNSYFANNLQRLQEIKTKYDLNNIFSNPQSVKPDSSLG